MTYLRFVLAIALCQTFAYASLSAGRLRRFWAKADPAIAIPTRINYPSDHNCPLDELYHRGNGAIPHLCALDQEVIGHVCYTKCPEGYSRWGTDCRQNCPIDFLDVGVNGSSCHRASYGRGLGYPSIFVTALDGARATSRCEDVHGRGNCEKWGLRMYPKCKPGFHPFGCCSCRPEKSPDCNSLDMGASLSDSACTKKIQIGDTHDFICAEDEDYDIGLCFKKCAKNYLGIGTICYLVSCDDL